MSETPNYWLLKSEPDCFSIHDLAKARNQTTCWDGVRNYQARNFMRDDMRVGDRVLFFHSGAPLPAVAGTAVVVREAYPDHTAWDKRDQHYDPKASPENPIWQMVDIRLERAFERPIALSELRQIAALKNMALLQRGQRLSVQRVRPAEFETVLRLAEKSADDSAAGNGAGRKRSAAKRKPASKKAAKKK